MRTFPLFIHSSSHHFLEKGHNDVKVRLTDVNGNYAEFVYLTEGWKGEWRGERGRERLDRLIPLPSRNFLASTASPALLDWLQRFERLDLLKTLLDGLTTPNGASVYEHLLYLQKINSQLYAPPAPAADSTASAPVTSNDITETMGQDVDGAVETLAKDVLAIANEVEISDLSSMDITALEDGHLQAPHFTTTKWLDSNVRLIPVILSLKSVQEISAIVSIFEEQFRHLLRLVVVDSAFFFHERCCNCPFLCLNTRLVIQTFFHYHQIVFKNTKASSHSSTTLRIVIGR